MRKKSLIYGSLVGSLVSCFIAIPEEIIYAEFADFHTMETVERMFPIVQTTNDDYKWNPEAPQLPDEAWLYIARFLDEVSLWNYGLVNRRLGAVLRGIGGFRKLVLALPDPKVTLLNILASSELGVIGWMYPLFLYDSKLAGMDMVKTLIGSDCTITKPALNSIRDKFLPRALDLMMIRNLWTHLFIDIDEELCAPSWMADDLYRCGVSLFGSLIQIFYLPKPSGTKLFDRTDGLTLGRIHWSGRAEICDMFVAALMADYVVPALKGDISLSDSETYQLGQVLYQKASVMRPYFCELLWASYFAHGEIESMLARIEVILRSIGINFQVGGYDKLRVENFKLKQDAKQKYDMKNVYVIAIQMCIDIQKIAKATSQNHLSILIQSNPDIFITTADISAQNIWRILFGDLEPEKVEAFPVSNDEDNKPVE